MKKYRSGCNFQSAILFFCGLVVFLLANARIASAQHAAVPSWKQPQDPNKTEAFWGAHQGGVVTPPQHHIYFAVFDLTTDKREDLVRLMKAWTIAAERMSRGETAQPLSDGLKLAVTPGQQKKKIGEEGEGESLDAATMVADTGETTGMSPARLTIAFGFGAGLFEKDGKDRFALAAQRPQALVEIPRFNGDQITPEHSGGDLVVQACAEDPQVAFHAVRQLARIAEGVAKIHWVQTGYRPATGERHLLGFSNGIGNPSVDNEDAMQRSVWVGDEGPAWMRGGTYMVVRRIRFAIEHWVHMSQAYQESALGRYKHPGVKSSDEKVSDTISDEGEMTHMQIVTPKSTSMLRRSYSYNNGVDFISERWPPWRQGLEYDAGMLFICYQKDPRTAFVEMYDKMSKYDIKLNQFWTHEASGLFAYPPAAREGEYVGQALLESH